MLGGERGPTTAQYNVTKSADHPGLRVSSTTTSFLLQPGDALSAVTALRTEAFAWDATPPASTGGHRSLSLLPPPFSPLYLLLTQLRGTAHCHMRLL